MKRKIPLELAEKIKSLKLSGIYLLNENKRFYPQGRLAAHVLGGVNIDDRGLAGVEYYYDSALRGQEGQQLIMKDARRKEYYIETITETEPGQDIYLTIDSNLQYLAEKELRQAIEKFERAGEQSLSCLRPVEKFWPWSATRIMTRTIFLQQKKPWSTGPFSIPMARINS